MIIFLVEYAIYFKRMACSKEATEKKLVDRLASFSSTAGKFSIEEGCSKRIRNFHDYFHSLSNANTLERIKEMDGGCILYANGKERKEKDVESKH